MSVVTRYCATFLERWRAGWIIGIALSVDDVIFIGLYISPAINAVKCDTAMRGQ
jgi:hypothetical protein